MPEHYGGYRLCLGDSDRDSIWGAEHRELSAAYVRQLQDDLVALGFRLAEDQSITPKRPATECDPRGVFGNYTAFAVREFQFYAKAPFATKKTGVGPLDFDVVPKTDAERLADDVPISGIVTPETADLLDLWQTNGWYCPLLVHGFQKPLRGDALPDAIAAAVLAPDGFNAWTRWDGLASVSAKRPLRYYAFDHSGLFRVPGESGAPQLDDLPIVTRAGNLIPVGAFSGGFVRTKDADLYHDRTLLPSYRMTPLTLTGHPFPAASAAIQSTWDVVDAVAALEAMRRFDVANAYDGAVISVGAFHWTVTAPKSVPTMAELPAFFSFCLRTGSSPEVERAWKETFGRYGLAVPAWRFEDPDGEDRIFPSAALRTYAAHLRLTGPVKKVASTAELDHPEASHRWSESLAIGGASPVEPFRSWHMFVRFVRWMTETQAIKAGQWDFARMRLRDILNIPIAFRPANHHWPTEVTLGEVFRTERLVGLLLRAHVNLPATLQVFKHKKKEIDIIGDALKAWTYAEKTKAPDSWPNQGDHWGTLFSALAASFKKSRGAFLNQFNLNMTTAMASKSALMQLSATKFFELDDSELPESAW